MPMSSNLLCISGRAEDRRVPRQRAPEHGPLQRARVTGRGASLEGDRACAAMKRAITQQPTDRGGINVVGASDISLRLASGEAPHGFLALMRRHLARTTEAHAARLGALATLARAGADKLALNSASPPSMVSISRPCGVVVSHHASLRLLKPAPPIPLGKGYE
jgi:hypothetical protein